VLGGEASGHLLCLDKATTGDGLVSALQVLAVMRRTGAKLAELTAHMERYPQVLVNVKVAKRVDLATLPAIGQAVAAAEARLKDSGRVVLRPSGTEPLIRVMVEGREEAVVRAEAEGLAAVVRSAAG